MLTPLRYALPLLLSTTLQLHAQDVIPAEAAGSLGSITVDGQTFTVVRAGDGHVWMQQNLGATQVAVSATDAASYGALYQWGRWTDGHQLRTSSSALATTLSPNAPSGLGSGNPLFILGSFPADWWANGTDADSWSASAASATNGIDPCAVLGVGWSLPTQADWDAVLAAEGITNVATAFSSHLKLPAAGSRTSDTGTLINVGVYGNYWSNTPSGSYAKDLTVGDSFVNSNDDAYRGYGMCVRCLNKFLHVGMEERSIAEGTRVFPNPSTGTITISTAGSPVKNVHLYAMDMRTVRTLSASTGTTLYDLGNVPNGTYALRIERADGTVWTNVVVQR